MRKSIIVFATLLVVLLLEFAIVGRAYRMVPTVENLSCITHGGDECNETGTWLLSSLRKQDKSWIEKTQTNVNSHLLQLATEERDRREIARQEEERKQDYIKQQAETEAEVQRLIDQANTYNIVLGGSDNPPIVFGVPGQEVFDKHVSHGTLLSDGSVMYDIGSSSADGESKEEDNQVDEPVYLGQFKAEFVCTCTKCLDTSTLTQLTEGITVVYADPLFIVPLSHITLSEGVTSELLVVDGSPYVSGREIIVCSAEHNVVSGLHIAYPKIYMKGTN